MTSHITSLHIRSVPVLDQDEALDFYTSHLGFEVRDDIDLGFMRWLTIGVPGQDTSLLLELVGHGVDRQPGDRQSRPDQWLQSLLEQVRRTGRSEEVERPHVDRRHSRGLLRDQQRQEECVEDRAGAVAERVILDRSARRLPQLAGELRDQARAAVRIGRTGASKP